MASNMVKYVGSPDGFANNGWFSNFKITNPFTTNNFKALGNSSIVQSIQGVGSSAGDVLKQLTHSQSQQDILNYGNNGKATMNDVYGFAKSVGFEGTLDDFKGNTEARNAYSNLYAANQTGDLKSTGTWGTEFTDKFNLGQTLGSVQNLLNIANSGWGLYANVQNYKTNKELASKQKTLLEQQIKDNEENMAYKRQERERQNRQRSNVTAQRSSESNVRSF